MVHRHAIPKQVSDQSFSFGSLNKSYANKCYLLPRRRCQWSFSYYPKLMMSAWKLWEGEEKQVLGPNDEMNPVITHAVTLKSPTNGQFITQKRES